MSRKGTVSEPDTNIPNQTEPVNAWAPERIIALRAALDLSQDEFGDLVGRSRQQVSGWENGTVALTRRMAAQLTTLEQKVAGHAPANAAPPAPDAYIIGRAAEVESLMAYALERQRLLIAAMNGQYRDSVLDRATPQLQARPAHPLPSAGE